MKLKTEKEIKKFRLKRNFLICGVYFLFEKDDIVYIGQSKNILTRINYHKQFKWDRFSFVEMKEGRRLRELEHKYISALKPKHNKKSNK